ncbi:MAG TPA: hypothetical protein VGX68_21440 [Thermoanaerobaculia bacterium]|jgi:hypothetical protein|nr:hypothetical protein [Thermoanaerobaculia bacterium]
MRKLIFACVCAVMVAALSVPAMAEPARGSNVLCYLWANQATSAIGVPYTPSTTYSFNAVIKTNANTVTRTAVGTYSVTCKGVGGQGWGAGGHVQVTAYGGEDADQCKVVSWVTGGADFTTTVRCFNHQGALSDNRFDLLFVW